MSKKWREHFRVEESLYSTMILRRSACGEGAKQRSSTEYTRKILGEWSCLHQRNTSKRLGHGMSANLP